MIRKSTINISYANKGKLETIDYILEESKRVTNLFIDHLWEQKSFNLKYINFRVDTWLSARMQKNIGKQALEIVKSQRKKKKKTKPTFNKYSFLFDSLIVKDIQFDNNSFDIWIKLSSIGNGISLNIPSKKHRHFNKFNSWNMRNSIRLRKVNNKYLVDLFFEKQENNKEEGKSVGLDCGYKKLLSTSEGKNLGEDLEYVYEKISRKQQGSKKFKKSLKERDNKINREVNKLDFDNIKTIFVENLKNVKKNSKGKINKKFNNKLQRWSYSKVLNKLSLVCESNGINLVKVDPSYTSQTCSRCGSIDKSNRKGEIYQCSCGLLIDADVNAAINIHNRGAYSPSTT